MSEILCNDLMYYIMELADPHTYVQLISTCQDMNQLGKRVINSFGHDLRSIKIDESLTVTIEGNKTSHFLPNGQLHGITKILYKEYEDPEEKHELIQEYYFGKLISETTDSINLFKIPRFDDSELEDIDLCVCCNEHKKYTKIYNYDKGTYVLKIMHATNGELISEGVYLISTNMCHGIVKSYYKPYNLYSFELFHKNEIFYSESFVENRIFQKLCQLDDENFQLNNYTNSGELMYTGISDTSNYDNNYNCLLPDEIRLLQSFEMKTENSSFEVILPEFIPLQRHLRVENFQNYITL
jgi:hypothetical protein